MTHVRHDGGPRGSGRARPSTGSDDDYDPGRELDELLGQWARDRDTLYQQDSSWLDELRTGGPRRSAEPAGAGRAPIQLPADHPSYPGPPPVRHIPPDSAGWPSGGPSGGPIPPPHGPNGYPASDPYPPSVGRPGPVDLQRALLGGPGPDDRWPADEDPGLLTHRDVRLLTHGVGAGLPPMPPAPPVAPGHRGLGPEPGDYPAEPFDSDGPAEPGYLPPSPPRRGRHRRGGAPRWLRTVGWIGAMVGLLVVAGASWGYYEYRKLSGNVRRIDVLAPNDPSIRDAARQRNAENFLLIGSDTRAGANGKYENTAGQVIGQRSDTTILAHLSPNRDKAILISIPRDSWVDIPACRKRDGSMSRAGPGMFNSAFETGGPKCTVLTVQKLTGVSINHYVQVDFTGFKTMVDALGGVTVCSRQDVHDKESGLRLQKGMQVLRGEQALAYVRARKHIGDWSDLGRIQRQQRFLGAMIRKATSTRLLFNPIALTRFLEAATRSLTLDRNTSFGDLKGLADQLRNLDPKRVTFLTAPIANADYTPPGQSGGGRVLLDSAAGRRLWDSIIDDKAAAPKAGSKASTGPKITLTVAPADVSVRVLNGVGVQGLARRTAADLTSVGFAVTDTGNSTTQSSVSVVRYAPGRLDAARTVAAAVPGSVLQEDASLGRTIVLVAGQSPVKVATVQVGDPAPAADATTAPATRAAAVKPPVTMSAADASCG